MRLNAVAQKLKSNYDLSDLAQSTVNYDLSDISVNKKTSYDLSDLSVEQNQGYDLSDLVSPSGNLATDVAKGVSRGYEYSMAGLGRFMSASGEKMKVSAESPTGKLFIPSPISLTIPYKKSGLQRKVDKAISKLGGFFESYGKEVSNFYQENAAKG